MTILNHSRHGGKPFNLPKTISPGRKLFGSPSPFFPFPDIDLAGLAIFFFEDEGADLVNRGFIGSEDSVSASTGAGAEGPSSSPGSTYGASSASAGAGSGEVSTGAGSSEADMMS